MRAVLRLGLAIAVAGLWLGQAPALAQSAPAATTNTPATDSIGPRELQNFNLQGTVTRPAEQAPAPEAPAPAPRQTARSTPAERSQIRSVRPVAAVQPRVETAASAARPPESLPIAPSVTPAQSAPASLPTLSTETPSDLAPQESMPVWPWLLAALALGAGGAFLFWRRNSGEAYAGGPQLDAFVAPEPEPQPRSPAPPAPPPPPAPKSVGIVSMQMRPWLEFGIEPLRCIVEERGVTFEFQLEVFNSGTAPARNVLVEANYFNAGQSQDQEIGAFFNAPVGQGERLAVIPPLQRISLRPKLEVAIEQLQMLEANGRKLFVPLVALNMLYGWGGGAGQTSAAWLIGRDTKGERLSPFRLDLGPRVFRGLGMRALPIFVRN